MITKDFSVVNDDTMEQIETKQRFLGLLNAINASRNKFYETGRAPSVEELMIAYEMLNGSLNYMVNTLGVLGASIEMEKVFAEEDVSEGN